MSEAALQRSVAQLLYAMGWMFQHVPGELYLHGTKAQRARQMQRMKRDGFHPGDPDFLIHERWSTRTEECEACKQGHFMECPKHGLCVTGAQGYGVAIELKAKGKYPTPIQKARMAEYEDRGWRVEVCRNMDQVMTLLACVRARNGRRI
jgi:hypothetical protein